ncbi:MAG: hypothetical protein H6Q88_3123, partial [Anaeromyxobacteraceae bacterium]|nr:hypothetical protein [Anaeromyxobacteraceae bacterium]
MRTTRAFTPSAPGHLVLQPLDAGELGGGQEEGVPHRPGMRGQALQAAGAVLHVHEGEGARRPGESQDHPPGDDPEEQEVLLVAGPGDAGRARHGHREPPGEGEGQPLRLHLRLPVPFTRSEGLLLDAGGGRRAGCRHRPGQDEAGEAGGVGGAGLEEEARSLRVHAQEVLPSRGAPDAGQVEDHVAPPDGGGKAPRVGDVPAGQLDVQSGERARRASGPDQGPYRVPPGEQAAGEAGPQESVGTRDERAHGTRLIMPPMRTVRATSCCSPSMLVSSGEAKKKACPTAPGCVARLS